jgi:uncharacterized membrane protein
LSLPLSTALVALISIVANRVLAVGVGLWLRVPPTLMLGLLIAIDAIQVPFFYRLYAHGFSFFDGIPAVKNYLNRDWSNTRLARWMMPLGGPGVMLVSAMPTFGGGIWLASFFAYALRLNRRAGFAWIMLGSVLSYVTLYWILDALVRTIRYFVY